MYAALALAALQSAGGFQQADIIRRNGDLQADVNNMNAKFADLDSYNALSKGYSDSARYDNVIDSAQAATRAAYASEGVAVGYGTAGAVEKDNRTAGLLNSLQLERNARDQAMGYQTQAINIRLGGSMTQLQAGLNANAAESSGLMKAAGTLVTGYQMSQSTGRGRDKDSGTSDKAWKNKGTTINSTADGKPTAPPHMYDNGYGWFPNSKDPNGPGFFGTQEGFDKVSGSWRNMAAFGNSYFGYGTAPGVGHSFTDEVGG